jgi:uncharacterized protein YdcH (DUF465 family)
MPPDHLDRALAEEFPGQAEAIHALKAKDASFRKLLERNHELWEQIQQIKEDIAPAEQDVLETLEKQRLAILDVITARLHAGEK